MEQAIRIQALKNEENKTYDEIEEELGVSSKTIAKALLRPEEFTEGYQREGPVPRPVLGAFIEKIEELLKGKDWAKEKGRKVRRTSRWVYRKIQKDGFKGAESTVRAFPQRGQSGQPTPDRGDLRGRPWRSRRHRPGYRLQHGSWRPIRGADPDRRSDLPAPRQAGLPLPC